MRRHLLMVSEKKIKMLKQLLSMYRVKYYRWWHNNLLQIPTYISNMYITLLINQMHNGGSYVGAYDRNGFSHHVTNTIGGATV